MNASAGVPNHWVVVAVIIITICEISMRQKDLSPPREYQYLTENQETRSGMALILDFTPHLKLLS